MPRTITRRQFGRTALSATALTGIGFPYLTQSQSPNNKLNIAAIGTGNRAGADIDGIAHENLVAIAEVDTQFMAQAKAKYPRAKGYRDFRVMLEKEADRIDAVVVGTPDHTHAPAAAMALRMGKHVYCEKPLTHTVHEARVLMQLAQERNLVTQMGTQIHAGENYRQVVELIRAGTIGTVTRADVWVNVGLDYSDGKFTTGTPAPDSLDWDLWLGPAPERPYSPGVHPFTWRKFWDYGTGRLGDFGCHYLDLVHWALGLSQPSQIQAQGPRFNPVSPPSWLTVNYQYSESNQNRAIDVTWHGGQKPKFLRTLRDAEGQPIDWGSGQLFTGTEGMILSNYSKHLVLRNGAAVGFDRPEKSIPRSVGHHREWTQAIRTQAPTTCNFDYAGNLTQAVLLGTVAFQADERLRWDPREGALLQGDRARGLLHKEYRAGWEL